MNTGIWRNYYHIWYTLKTNDLEFYIRLCQIERAKGGVTKYKMTCPDFHQKRNQFQDKCFVVTVLHMGINKTKKTNDLHLAIYTCTATPELIYIWYVNNYDKNGYLEKIWKAAVHDNDLILYVTLRVIIL